MQPVERRTRWRESLRTLRGDGAAGDAERLHGAAADPSRHAVRRRRG